MSTTQQCDLGKSSEDKMEMLEKNQSNMILHIFQDYNASLCSICKRPLQAPIKYVVKLGNVCGLCYELEDENKNPNWLAYSIPLFDGAIAMISTIPMACKNKQFGCEEILYFSNKQEHELKCKLIGVHCLLCKSKVNRCNWRGVHSKLLDHFHEFHQDAIMHSQDGTFEIELLTDTDFEYNRLLEFREERVFLSISGDLTNKKISYILLNAKPQSNSNHSDQMYSLKYYEKLNGNFFVTKVSLKSFESLLEDTERQNINFDGILNIFSCTTIPKLNCRLTFPTTNAFKQNLLNNLNHMEDLNCVTCLTIMRPPIYLCSSGHSICSSCYKNLKSNCPLCKNEYKGSRNYSMENFITSFYNFPCSYQKFGCSISDSHKNLIKHEMKCLYKVFKCPLKNCTFTDVESKFSTHLMKKHGDSLILNEMNYEENIFNSNETKYKYFVKYQQLFEFYYSTVSTCCYSSYKLDKLYFSLRMLGEQTPEILSLVSKFSFEVIITIINPNEWNPTFSKIAKCLPPSGNVQKDAISFDLKSYHLGREHYSKVTVGRIRFRLIHTE